MLLTKKLIAPCGMNCALCAAYLREKKKCPGCRDDDTDKNKSCRRCRIKNCLQLKKNRWQYCYRCGAFPCDKIKHIDQRYRAHYHMSMVANLAYTKKRGIKAFLADQQKKWQCRKCGGLICCHNGLCFHCDAKKLKAKKRKYRWEGE